MIRLRLLLILLFCGGTALSCIGQGAIDGYMKGRGNTDVALSYSTDSYSVYYFGSEERAIDNTTQTINFFASHGFTDSLDIVFSIPFIWTDSLNRGIQDGIVALKYRPYRAKLSSGNLSLIGSIGASFPLSNYKTSSANPIGQAATILQSRVLAQYDAFAGWFLQIQSGYELRFNPVLQHILPVSLKAGYSNAFLYLDTWLDYYRTFNAAADTRIFAGSGTSYLRVGGTIYYGIQPQYGVFLGGAYTLSGENIGQSTRYNVGLVYKFMAAN
ncbi:MAG: hypothetical protein AB8G15_04185 [Saprospiraceae bacterium]